MKCDELKVYVPQDGPYGLEPEEGGALVEEETCYLKSEVDAAIAELKQKLEDVQASHYAEMVDAGMRERRLRRALWLARAERAKAIKWHEGLERYLQERKKYWPSRFSFMKEDEMYHVWYKRWCKVESKCRDKAEDYK